MPQPEVAWTDQDWRSVWKVNADFSAWKPKAETEHTWRDSFQVSIVFKENLREGLVAEDSYQVTRFEGTVRISNSSLCRQLCINLLRGKILIGKVQKSLWGWEDCKTDVRLRSKTFIYLSSYPMVREMEPCSRYTTDWVSQNLNPRNDFQDS